MESPRPLRHIEHFDNAGRGLWGSLKLLFFAIQSYVTMLRLNSNADAET